MTEPPDAARRPCPECGAGMTLGFLLDQSTGGRAPTFWVEGAPEPSFWTGTKTSGRPIYAVETYRCAACGALRSYAVSQKR